MGYTHYWDVISQPENRVFAEFSRDCEKIIQISGIPICGPFGDGEPSITDREVMFNGEAAADNDFETFSISFVSDGFDFCKTGQRPYDSVVCAILLAAKRYFGRSIHITSDGFWEEWARGRDIYKDVYGVDAECPWT